MYLLRSLLRLIPVVALAAGLGCTSKAEGPRLADPGQEDPRLKASSLAGNKSQQIQQLPALAAK